MLKALDNSGPGSYSDVASGIKSAADQGWDVGPIPLSGGKSSTVEETYEYAHNNGVLLVAAAGKRRAVYGLCVLPGRGLEVIAVSATEKDDSLASYSSTGSNV